MWTFRETLVPDGTPSGESDEVAQILDDQGQVVVDVWNPKERDRQNLRSMVIAHNAGDVMRRRFWFPRFCGTINDKQRWAAYSWVALDDVSELFHFIESTHNVCPRESDCPFDALIDADKWLTSSGQ